VYLGITRRRYGEWQGLTALGAMLVLLVFSVTASAAESRSVRFQHISRDEGLSQSFVYAILQDQDGFMWFGTQDGLNRYDGYDFKVFVHHPDDPQSISDESTRTMILDRSGTLWAGTDAGGLSRYNRATETFTNYRHDPEDPASIASNRIRIIYEDSRGDFWVGTDGSGLDRFDRDTGVFEHFKHDAENPASLSGVHVWSITENSNGDLLVGTDGGLSKLNTESGLFTNYYHDPDNGESIRESFVRTVFEDANQDLWIGTESQGLSRLDHETGKFEHFLHNPDDPSSIGGNRVNVMFQDDAGVLWIGTRNGLSAWNSASRNFENYTYNPSDKYSLSHNNISSIFQDRGGVLWVGTYKGLNLWNQTSRAIAHYRHDMSDASSLSEDTILAFAEDKDGSILVGSYGGGVSWLDKDSDNFRHLRHSPGDPSSLSSDLVMSLLVDSEGVLWVGTRSSGLNRYDKERGNFEHFLHSAEDATSISANGVTFIFEDSRNDLWFGTFGGGMNKFDRQTQTFTRYRHNADDSQTLSNDRVLAMFEDSRGGLWFGTYGGGLSHLDPSTGVFKSYHADPDRFDGLSGNEIYLITEDVNGDFWIGVKGRGLNRWRLSDRENGTESFQRFTTQDGLPSATIIGGVWDQEGHLWLSTGRGISRLDIASLKFKNYDTSHGLQDDEFNVGAYFGASDGRMYFGGVNGFNALYPERLNGGGLPPQVAITRFLSLNDAQQLAESPRNGAATKLGHNENVIGFEFSAFDFAAPHKNQFMYQLEGIDRAWVNAGSKHQVTYSNLPAGDYVFRVKGANNNGVWSAQDATFEFTMLPAPWRTWWAYSAYLAVLIALIIAAIRAHTRNVRQTEELKHATELGVIQARLTDAQRMANIGNWEWNFEPADVWWSDQIYRLLLVEGDSPLTFNEYLDRVHPNDRKFVDEVMQKAIDQGQTYSIDYRIRRFDGATRIVHEHGEARFDENGKPVGMTGTLHDITEHKQAEDGIRRRAEFQELLAKLSTELIQAQPRKIEKQINNGLASIGARFRLDAISIWWFSGNRADMRPLHRWVRVPNTNPVDGLRRDQIPWVVDELTANRAIKVNDIDSLPDAAATDEQIFRERGVKSLLIFPLQVEERIEGVCSFALLQEKRDWSDTTIAELRLVTESLTGAIARAHKMARIEHLKNELQQENYYLREKVKLAHGFDEIVGEDAGLRQCLLAVEKVAPTDVTTLILGETGTGKELIARAIHKLSARSDRPMVSVNCPALPENLIESELFGHEKGAFTGAESRRHGRFEIAHTGTLFLDEIGELPLDLQGKLLRVLQTGEFQRIGGTKTLHSDVRLIAATNRDLEQSIARGEFRADLYYRICSFPISLPALRDRKGDIPLLTEHFVHKHAERLGKKINTISARMIKELVEYAWPGNIRELESVVERALISAQSNSILELPTRLGPPATKALSPANVNVIGADLSTVERTHILGVLQETNWKISGVDGAAAILGLPSSTLRSKMKRHGIERSPG
jgi:transcriptional regulator with GAF, ATPase, and Fis domain/ligand-binding sensor domain-containing protein